MQLNCVRRIKKASGGESIGKYVIAQLVFRAAILGIQVIVVLCGTAKIQRSMVLHVAAGACSDIQYATKTVAVFGGEAAGHQVNCFKDLRAGAGTELRLRVIQKRNAVDEFMQRKFIAAHVRSEEHTSE